MIALRLPISLRTPLGTPLAGDTLFGQLCWAMREAHGETELERLLDGYTQGHPWLVVGDGLPTGYLPRPTIPMPSSNDASERKKAKGKRWVAFDDACKPLPTILDVAKTDDEIFGKGAKPTIVRAHHNTLNRLTSATGTGEFVPYTMAQIHHAPDQKIDIWSVLDETRCDQQKLHHLFQIIGASGFGRDASIGLGKFEVDAFDTAVPPPPTFAQAYWTLGPCAPQGQGFNGAQSFWRVTTRFGRHGSTLALAANPFKHPLLLAAAGAIFVPLDIFTSKPFIGQGLSNISSSKKEETVHQGYAPVLPLQLEAAS